MIQVDIVMVECDEPGVVRSRVGNVLTLTVTSGTETMQAALMARQLCTLEERDAVRALFGLPSTAEVPGVEVWDDLMEPTVNQMLEGQVAPLAAP